ncbi:alpha/beta fold hydrolase [Halohasta litorea]|uniref:Alpha/beta fold hydrolase n=1 Tax=Halohasta litorea TaxID=869891 RepID=A0ABD6D8H7_9EURY|nr:alpha/beta hydrolase [Halohasta litorea]
MSYADADGCEIYYERSAADPDAPTVVLIGDLALGGWQWGWQYSALAGLFETIVYDPRGCGRSDAPLGPYTMRDMVGDLEAILQETNTRRAHLVGCGLGGCIALAAARYTSRAESLTLIGTPASGKAFDASDLLADPADTEALRASTTGLLSTDFREDQPDVVDRIVEWRSEEDASPGAQQAQLAAIDGFDAEPLYELTTPAFVVAGGVDSVVDVAESRRLAEELPRGELQEFPEAGHLLTVERSAVLNDELVGWLEA